MPAPSPNVPAGKDPIAYHLYWRDGRTYFPPDWTHPDLPPKLATEGWVTAHFAPKATTTPTDGGTTDGGTTGGTTEPPPADTTTTTTLFSATTLPTEPLTGPDDTAPAGGTKTLTDVSASGETVGVVVVGSEAWRMMDGVATTYWDSRPYYANSGAYVGTNPPLATQDSPTTQTIPGDYVDLVFNESTPVGSIAVHVDAAHVKYAPVGMTLLGANPLDGAYVWNLAHQWNIDWTVPNEPKVAAMPANMSYKEYRLVVTSTVTRTVEEGFTAPVGTRVTHLVLTPPAV